MGFWATVGCTIIMFFSASIAIFFTDYLETAKISSKATLALQIIIAFIAGTFYIFTAMLFYIAYIRMFLPVEWLT